MQSTTRIGSQDPTLILHEFTIIEAVAKRLVSNGWKILSKCKGRERGDDLVATRNGESLRIEAKGEGSSDPGSAKFGKRFDRGETRMNVAEAFHRAVVMGDSNTDWAGMAFPDNSLYREHVGRVQNAISKLRLTVFWVAADGTVQIEPDPVNC
jgi:hypothetical protein